MRDALAALLAGRDLPADLMRSTVGAILDGEASDAQIGAFLTALTLKGETVEEMVAAVLAMRRRALQVELPEREGPLLDTCGTGGDGLGTFNVSTATAFVVAAGGVRVAKHGNRAASGKVGAADVLEALGARIELSPECAREALETTGFTFLFAPVFHPALGRLAGPRRELGFRTLFNLLGPLCNPAGVDHQLIGVYDAACMETVANALIVLGTRRALLVHGHGGADELTSTGPAEVVEVSEGRIRSFTIDPQAYGLARSTQKDLEGGDRGRSAAIIRDVLSGGTGPAADTVALNAGAAFQIADVVPDLGAGVDRARELMADGAPARKLAEFVSFTLRSAP
ncbi:MAG: anthranilate phosphoribosyltransferase [Candidatus Binatia bacterium]